MHGFRGEGDRGSELSLIMRGSRGGGVQTLNNHKTKGFLTNTGPDPLKNYKAAKPAFNAEPSMAHQRNAI